VICYYFNIISVCLWKINSLSLIAAARESGAAAELAASRKEVKYAALDGRYIFELIAIETLDVFNTSARQLLSNLGKKIFESTGEAR